MDKLKKNLVTQQPQAPEINASNERQIYT